MELLFAIHSKADQSAQEVRCDVQDRVVFGRTPDSPVPMDGPGVSREHFSVNVESDQVSVIDLSANGTWLNGARIAKGRQHPVTTSDLVEIPGYEIRFQTVGAPVAKVTTGPVEVAPIESGDFPAAAAVAAVVVPEAKKSPLAFVGDMVDSFTGLEKFIIVVDISGIVLLAWYFGT